MNWYLLGVEMNLGHAYKTRFWYLLGVFLKFSDEQPGTFNRGVPPPPRALLFRPNLRPFFKSPTAVKFAAFISVHYNDTMC